METSLFVQAKIQAKRKRIAIRVLQYFLLALFSLFFMIPFIVMICYSFLPDNEALKQVLFSKKGIVNIGTYLSLLKNQMYLRYLLNTTIVAVIAAVGVPLASSLCAYSFAKLDYPGRNALFSVVLATMMLPGIVTQIPLYNIYVKLNWTNTLFPMWVPGLLGGGATNIFLMTQFMRGIPKDLSNAAKLDGASHMRIFLCMMIPLCIPVFLLVMVNSFIGSWNDFMTPLLYITDKTKWTLSLGIFKDYGGPVSPSNLPNKSMAAGVVMMLPCLVLFFIFQRYLIEGVSFSGMKG